MMDDELDVGAMPETEALFDDTECLEMLAKLEEEDKTPYQRRKEFPAAQEERVKLLMRDGHTVRIGPGGVSVFRGTNGARRNTEKAPIHVPRG